MVYDSILVLKSRRPEAYDPNCRTQNVDLLFGKPMYSIEPSKRTVWDCCLCKVPLGLRVTEGKGQTPASALYMPTDKYDLPEPQKYAE